LFGICLSAVFLAGDLEFVIYLKFSAWNLLFICDLLARRLFGGVLGICDFKHKTPRQSQISLTPAMRDRLGPSKIPLCGGGPGFLGHNKFAYFILRTGRAR
jgi:hypothetical protein